MPPYLSSIICLLRASVAARGLHLPLQARYLPLAYWHARLGTVLLNRGLLYILLSSSTTLWYSSRQYRVLCTKNDQFESLLFGRLNPSWRVLLSHYPGYYSHIFTVVSLYRAVCRLVASIHCRDVFEYLTINIARLSFTRNIQMSKIH